MPSPLSLPGAKPTLLLSLSMTFLGVTGIMIGYQGLSSEAPATPQPPPAELLAPEQVAELDRIEQEVRASTVPEALAAGNLLLSPLLVLAGFLLTARRPSALWWTSQALGANALYTVASTVGQIYVLFRWPRLLQIVVTANPSMAEAMAQPDAPTPAEVAAAANFVLAAFLAIFALVLLAIYLFLWRLSRRSSVRSFIGG